MAARLTMQLFTSSKVRLRFPTHGKPRFTRALYVGESGFRFEVTVGDGLGVETASGTSALSFTKPDASSLVKVCSLDDEFYYFDVGASDFDQAGLWSVQVTSDLWKSPVASFRVLEPKDGIGFGSPGPG